MNRTATLTALVKVTMPTQEAVSRLAEFSWDSESELVLLTSENFCHVLSLFKQGSLSAAEVEDLLINMQNLPGNRGNQH
jgi:N-acetylglucosamine-6-phosphate deacetylase